MNGNGSSQEGRHARDRGDPSSANPYPSDTEEHATWKRGWEMPDREIGQEKAKGDQE